MQVYKILQRNLSETEEKTMNHFRYYFNALAIGEPLEYARLALDGEMQMWVDAMIVWQFGDFDKC